MGFIEDYIKYSQDRIQSRQLDTLIGLAKGLVADNKINQAEAEFLQDWLLQNYAVTEHPVITELYPKVAAFLVDGVLDDEEAGELLALLKSLVGQDENATLGEVFHPSSLPLNQPPPKVIFNGKKFLFTGTFAYGTRKDCHKLIESLGGESIKGIRQDLDYLVIGQYVTETWRHESFGRKIEQAVEYQKREFKVQIISEKHWLESCQNGE